MIIVTGGAGFIGSNLVAALNGRGRTDILVVDDLTDGRKCLNLAGLRVADVIDKDEFRALIRAHRRFGPVEAVFHQGACAVTTEWNGKAMMAANYDYSKDVLAWCAASQTRLIYASSAAVYGRHSSFSEELAAEAPINPYGYSKWQFDQYVRAHPVRLPPQWVGLRYFNVYGPREAHKDAMASVAFHLNRQLRNGDEVKLFQGSHGYGDGAQERDFVYVGDVAAVNLWFLDHPNTSGIFNVGTGQAESFNAVAKAVLAWHGRGKLTYIPFPPALEAAYQPFTRADLTRLRAAGCDVSFRDVATGVRTYLDHMAQEQAPQGAAGAS